MTTTRKPADILPRLTEWAAVHAKVYAQYQALRALTNCAPEAPLSAALWASFDAYTKVLSELIGDEHEWLDWWRLECDMGQRRKAVEVAGRVYPVKTLRDLARVICDTRGVR